jgi:predicted phage baseplate assembly protein
MALVVPKLDDRQFQDIVDEAKKRIPQYCKEWTDHNVSDPGVTLIELFAWMTDILLYRLNRVPDLHYIKFMEMLGITLKEPAPAKVPVTFWLSAPQSTPVLIPKGTEVASTQTETEGSIIFTTDEDLHVQPPVLVSIASRVTSSDGQKKGMQEHNIRRLQTGFEGAEVFSKVPQIDDALYFGFENDLSNHILGFEMDFDPAGGAGVDPAYPPYIWEASTGQENKHWETCPVEIDNTKGMNVAGRIRIHLPKMGIHSVNNADLYWVRVRIRELTTVEAKEGARPYRESPRLRQVSAASWGGTVSSIHSQRVQREFLGQSDGTAGQRFNIKFKPLLKRLPEEYLTVQIEGETPQKWAESQDFSGSGAEDRHYTLDSINGELRFGPAVRQQDGTIKLYGAIPPRRALLTLESYRYGGGQEGNVQVGILNTLKTAIPYVSKVMNRFPASGGLDAETLDSAMMRAPALLHSRERAVTESDFEFLASQALPAEIGRVRCLQPNPTEANRIIPGQVYLLVIPRISHPEGRLEPEQLALKPEAVSLLTSYLDERRLLTTRLDVRPPAYQWVSVKIKLRAKPGADQSKVENDILNGLYLFLNPLTGWTDGKGWPFGRELYSSDIFQCLQGVPNIQFIRGLDMFTSTPTGLAQGEPLEVIDVVAHGVIASGIHSIEFV